MYNKFNKKNVQQTHNCVAVGKQTFVSPPYFSELDSVSDGQVSTTETSGLIILSCLFYLTHLEFNTITDMVQLLVPNH